MTILEKVAYIKGLAEGMKLDTEKNEGKILSEIIDVLSDICDEIDSLNEAQLELCEQLDAVDEDLSGLEDFIYEDDEDCGCESCKGDDEFEDEVYEITCPNCNDTLYVDGEMLDEGGIDCPNCGTALEFDFDCDCEDCDCEKCDCEE